MRNELLHTAPIWLLAVSGLLQLLLGLWPQHFGQKHLLAIAVVLLLTVATIASALFGSSPVVSTMLVVDDLGRFFIALFSLVTAGILIISNTYAPLSEKIQEEYLSLVLFAVFGMALLCVVNHLLTAFLGLETLAISLYALIAWRPESQGAIEGGVKYAVLAGLAAAFIIFGIGLVYAGLGTLSLDGSGLNVSTPTPLIMAGVSVLLVGIGFKLALVPFHMWAPDVYQAAPTPITTIFATVAKAAVLIFLIRLFTQQWSWAWQNMLPILWWLAVISMIVGNLLALLQQNIKRLLAYSSIAQLGYILVALAAGNAAGQEAALFYTLAYVVMNLGVFTVVAALAYPDRDREQLHEYQGMGRRYPILGATMAVCLLALAGLPPTVGFMAKFFAFSSAVDADLIILVIIAVLNTVVSFFYYLRVIMVFFKKQEGELELAPLTFGTRLVATAAMVATLGLGVFPK